MDPTLLQKLLDGYRDALAPGLATMKPFVTLLLSFLVALEGIRVWNRILEGGGHWQHAGGFVVRSMALASLVGNWPPLLSGLIEDCVHAGLTFGGNQMTVQQFLDPGTLLVQGVNTSTPLMDAVRANSGITSLVYGLGFLGAFVFFIAAFFVMSISVFLVQVEFRIVLPVTLIALTFLFFGPTRSMGLGALSYGLNTGLKFFLKAVMASATFRLIPILAGTTFVQRNAFDAAMLVAALMIAAAWMQAYLFLKIPSLVLQVLQGGGGLSVGSAMQAVNSALLLGRNLGLGGGGRRGGRSQGGTTRTPGVRTVSGTVIPPTPAPSPFGPNTRIPERMELPAASRALPAPEAVFTMLRDGAQYYSPPPPRSRGAVVPYRSVVKG